MNEATPTERGIAMAVQNHAQMTVRQDIGLSLRLAGMAGAMCRRASAGGRQIAASASGSMGRAIESVDLGAGDSILDRLS